MATTANKKKLNGLRVSERGHRPVCHICEIQFGSGRYPGWLTSRTMQKC